MTLLFTFYLLLLSSDDLRLTDEVGRREFRVYAAPFQLETGLNVVQADLPMRLKRLGYKRVSQRPTEPGQFFWGTENFYVYQRPFRHAGKDRRARLLQVTLIKSRITAVLADGKATSAMLEPELLCESLDQRLAQRFDLHFDRVEELVWRPLLAAEDARFFSHIGLDSRALARSALANIKAGKVKQGGSTITQQLIKGRDLTPKRSFGRKASEAWRALWMEANYSKEEILEAYLNHVYMGHQDGYAIHGYGAAARAFFNKSVDQLTLVETASLAAMVQGPNRLSPVRNPDQVKVRRDWVLDRMVSLQWLEAAEAARLKATPVVARQGPVTGADLSWYRSWLKELVAEFAPRRAKKDKGVVLETSLDPVLQDIAEAEARREGERLRKTFGNTLQLALVCLDARNGAVLAYVGGYPGPTEDHFDRVRKSKRQPGSLVKPFILLEAFGKASGHPAYHGATLVADQALTVKLPSGPWEPRNNDRRFHGTVTLQEALRHSYNVPFVRLGRHVGEAAVARTMRKAGLTLPNDPPPSFLLGTMEVTPLAMASAYTLFTSGKRWDPMPLTRIEKPGGRRLHKFRPDSHRVSSSAVAWKVDQLLQDSVARGSGQAARLADSRVSGKTGTSSDGHDAWFAGRSGSLVTVVWIGFDSGKGKGLSGGAVAARLFHNYTKKATPLRPNLLLKQPRNITKITINPTSGLRVNNDKKGLDTYVTRTAIPGKKRWWRKSGRAEVIR